MGHRFGIVSPATVIAALALLVALGGTAYAAVVLPANSVGVVQLKNNAVSSPKVLDRSLLARDFAPGQIPAGSAGPAGPGGPAGPAGPAGPSGAGAGYIVHVASQDIAALATGSALAACASGQKATGGGALLLGTTTDTEHLTAGAPVTVTGATTYTTVSDGGTATGWFASVYNSGPVSRTLKVYVICS